MTTIIRFRMRGFRFILPLVLFASGLVVAHEPLPPRPEAKGPINPKESFQFLALSGAGGHFHSLLFSPDAKTLFAGTHLGLFRSEDRGLTWRLAASRFSGEDVHGLARDPKTGSLYVATHGQGLLVSRDGGVSWTAPTPGLPGRDLHALALEPRSPPILYTWVVEHGLFRSEDHGYHWRLVAKPRVLSGVESLATHPEKSGRLYAGTATGVWISDDGGRQWRFPDGGLRRRTAGVAVPPWRPDFIFAATLDGAFVGRADGTGWEPLPSPPEWWGLPIGFAFLTDQPGVVCVVTHEGVVAARPLAGEDWIPLANLRMGGDRVEPSPCSSTR